MWRSAERVKHAIPPVRWPSAQEAARSRLYQPLQYGRFRLADRTWVPAMVPWRATEAGFVTADVLDWYERFARGRPGALVVEATGIRDVPSGPLLRAGADRFIPGLAELVAVVRAASRGRTRLFLQLIDFLAVKRRPERETFLRRFLTVTDSHRQALGMPDAADEAVIERLVAIADDELGRVLAPREMEALSFGYRERVTDLHLDHIRALPVVLPDLFADAAARAQASGFDGVELHYAHAYTMASFLSATNDRDDGYGGSLEGRLRLPLDVFRAVRARVGESFVVGCRYLTEETIAGGSTVEDAVRFGTAFAAAGFDYLSLSRGGKFEDARQPAVGWAVYPYTGRSGWECMPTVIGDARGPFGRNVAAAARVRAGVRAAGFETPVVVVGGLHGFDQMEGVLADGAADIVGAARQSLADPDWFLKMRLGLGPTIRRCSFTNYCEGLDQKHKQVTCKLWDRVDVEGAGRKRSRDGMRRLVAPDADAALEDTARADEQDGAE